MAKFQRHCVDIMYREGDLMMFDFEGIFAFILEHGDKVRADIYPHDHYQCCFQEFLDSIDLEIFIREEWLILPDDYEKAHDIAHSVDSFRTKVRARQFLKHVFPRHYALLAK